MTLEDLYTTILSRKDADPSSSWTAQLLAKGPEKCAEKFGEEAIEAIIEAIKDDKAALTSEAADVLYHLMVMLACRDIPLGDVMNELARRQAQSGIAEKAARYITSHTPPPEKAPDPRPLFLASNTSGSLRDSVPHRLTSS